MGAIADEAAVKFLANPLWAEAKWIATTFRWHLAGEQPPVMGLVFEDANAGLGVFEEWIKDGGNEDAANDLRVSIIEGSPDGQPFGYSVHIGLNPETVLARATAEGVVVDAKALAQTGRVNRMYPVPGAPPMLPKFKAQYWKHREFLLAPVTRGADGQLWVNVEFGIVKKEIFLRRLEEITPDDVDAVALALPAVIGPREAGRAG